MNRPGTTPGKSRLLQGRRRWIRWGLPVLAVFIAYQVLMGPRGVLKVMELRAEKKALLLQIDSLQARQRELLRERQRLLTDTAYLERLARKELGMARPGEKVYRFVTPSGGDSASKR